jgi:hypothetical protein
MVLEETTWTESATADDKATSRNEMQFLPDGVRHRLFRVACLLRFRHRRKQDDQKAKLRVVREMSVR